MAEAPPLDLMLAVPTEVAASSAYRDRANEIAKLFDGDVETAWNSRTGDLERPWIEVRLPDDVRVSSIELTSGFTRGDLFEQNFRVARVRVLRDGRELGVYPLDTGSRDLQSLPVVGPGGVYRLELVDLLPGSRNRWREVCVSELRVLGRGPGAQEGTRFPRFAVGALPAPRTTPTPPSPDVFATAFRRRTRLFEVGWMDYESELIGNQDLVFDSPRGRQEALNRVLRTRARLLASWVELIEPLDAEAADRLRRVLSLPPAVGSSSAPWAPFMDDLDVLVDVLDPLVEALDEQARCTWARVHGHVRLGRIVAIAHELSRYEDMGEYDEEEMEQGGTGPTLGDVAWELRGALDDWPADVRGVAGRLSRMPAPGPDVNHDWSRLLAAISSAQAHCGWH